MPPLARERGPTIVMLKWTSPIQKWAATAAALAAEEAATASPLAPITYSTALRVRGPQLRTASWAPKGSRAPALPFPLALAPLSRPSTDVAPFQPPLRLEDHSRGAPCHDP